MPIRNPFAKRTDTSNGVAPNDENRRPGLNGSRPTFEKVDTMGSKASSSMSINTRKSEDVGEYKMSVVNDSGVYLPPSPPEKKGFWPRRSNPSTINTTNHRACLNDNEPFSISRESFDSYRRSFDISARSPIMQPEGFGRQSLDSARIPRLPRSAVGERRFEAPEPTKEEGFEDVGLDDNKVDKPAKRKSFFSKFGDSNDNLPAQSSGSSSRFHLTGRKRGQSGQGAELGDMPTRDGSPLTEVK